MTTTLNLSAAATIAVCVAIGGAALRAQETRSTTLLTTEHWLDWERVNDAQISPDGTRIVYTRQAVNTLEDKWESSLWMVNADGSQHRFLVKGSAARWSPDGKRLLYLADGEPKGSQIFVRCSGGGVLSSWVIGHTDRFAGAAVRCPVIDWLSFAGHTDIPFFTYSFFKKPFWEDPSDWLSHSSLMTVGKVTTPTLLMTGVLDRRTPMPQTEEYYAALKMKGVPVKMLQFNEEYHGTGSKRSNYTRTQLYMMSWFNKYTRQAGGRITTAGDQP